MIRPQELVRTSPVATQQGDRNQMFLPHTVCAKSCQTAQDAAVSAAGIQGTKARTLFLRTLAYGLA
jgi:hypothetical protein